MWYTRYFEKKLEQYLLPGKVLVLYGPRRVGKTSLINKCLADHGKKIFATTGEDLPTQEIFKSQNINQFKLAFSDYDILFIDEAQALPNVGLGLKLLTDHLQDLKIIASGSSSFDLSNKIGEPLTGRHHVLKLFPLSVMELKSQLGGMAIHQMLEELLVFGSFPDVLANKNKQDKTDYLGTLRDSYLLKDILILETIKNSSKLLDLLKLIAFQIGQPVSLNELANQLQMSKNTVTRYLDLFEKAFIIKRVQGFTRNLRKEITKTARYYFLDNGIRNAVINNFASMQNRNDVGMLWENFCFIERQKRNGYLRSFANTYFWRTYDRQEIDYVEEKDGTLKGFEFKWKKTSAKTPAAWKKAYPDAEFEVISKENYLSFMVE